MAFACFLFDLFLLKNHFFCKGNLIASLVSLVVVEERDKELAGRFVQGGMQFERLMTRLEVDPSALVTLQYG
jgi:hypothetical protein